MHIVIDARLFGPKHTGIGRYSQNLVENLYKLNSQHQFTLITHPKAKILPPPSNFKVIKTDIGHYGYAEQFKLLKLLNSLSADLVHFTHFNHPIFYSKPFIVTIHDLIKSDFKDYSASTRNKIIYEFKHFIYKKVIAHAVNKSQAIITPSKYSKSRIISHFPNTDREKIHTIYEGADQFFDIRVQKVIDYKKYSISSNFCLYIGNSYPYKNLTTAILALKKIPSLQFVIVSRSGKNLNELKKNASDSKKFIFLQNLSDSEIADLYRRSKFFLFPSKSEGFGVPGLEAMAMQTPLISSSAGPLPEVYGKAALYFDPENVNQLVDRIEYLLSDYINISRRLNRLAKLQLNKYSWAKNAAETYKVYENCLSI